ncbi:MAG: hypothetical protein GC178_15115 [Flavobacteriales bacterium]|nr:hypothetical protein [Flavobacteriales bacterium]
MSLTRNIALVLLTAILAILAYKFFFVGPSNLWERFKGKPLDEEFYEVSEDGFYLDDENVPDPELMEEEDDSLEDPYKNLPKQRLLNTPEGQFLITVKNDSTTLENIEKNTASEPEVDKE